jgi:hypothetical protein
VITRRKASDVGVDTDRSGPVTDPVVAIEPPDPFVSEQWFVGLEGLDAGAVVRFENYELVGRSDHDVPADIRNVGERVRDFE